MNRATRIYHIEKICHYVAEYFSVEVETLKKTYKNNYPRLLAIYLARNLTQLTHQKISDFFIGIKRSSVSTTIIKCKKLLDKNYDMNKHYLNLLQKIRNDS